MGKSARRLQGLAKNRNPGWLGRILLAQYLCSLPVHGEQSVVDYFGGLDKIPEWCRGCGHPQYLEELRKQMVKTIYSPMRWMMQGFVAMTAGDVDNAFISLAVGRRVGELAETHWAAQADDFLDMLHGHHPQSQHLHESQHRLVWEPYSTLVLDTLTDWLVPLITEKGERLLTKDYLRVFIESLASTHDHILRPLQLVPRSMLALPGFRKAAKLRSCWNSGIFGVPIERIDARRYHHAPSTSIPLRLSYVRNHKAASSTIMKFLTGHVGGPTPYKLGRSAFPGHTWFTFVRDPVKKLVSAFFEVHRPGINLCQDALADRNASSGVRVKKDLSARHLGSGRHEFCHVGMNPWNVRVDNKASQQAVMKRFVSMLSALEDRSFSDHHTDSQSERLLMFPDRDGTIDFIGDFARLDDDWADLAAVQQAAFGISLGALSNRLHVTKPSMRKVWSSSVLPVALLERICMLYRNDYCCLDLPLPTECQQLIAC